MLSFRSAPRLRMCEQRTERLQGWPSERIGRAGKWHNGPYIDGSLAHQHRMSVFYRSHSHLSFVEYFADRHCETIGDELTNSTQLPSFLLNPRPIFCCTGVVELPVIPFFGADDQGGAWHTRACVWLKPRHARKSVSLDGRDDYCFCLVGASPTLPRRFNFGVPPQSGYFLRMISTDAALLWKASIGQNGEGRIMALQTCGPPFKTSCEDTGIGLILNRTISHIKKKNVGSIVWLS